MSEPLSDAHNPYAPPSAPVQDAAPAVSPGELAERSSRLGAYVVDALIWLVIEFPAIIVAIRHWSPTVQTRSQIYALFYRDNGAVPVSAVLFLIWAIITIVLVSRNGQSIGKRAVGIKVVRRDGSKATLGRIFWLRNVVNNIPSLIPLLSMFYWLVDTLMILGEERRCLHDRIADTIVVKA